MKNWEIYRKFGISLFFVLFFSCDATKSEENQYVRTTGNSIDGVRLAWDYSSMQRLAPRGTRTLSWTSYPRIKRLNDASYLVLYEAVGSIEMIRSSDRGESWSEPVVLFSQKEVSNSAGKVTIVKAANPELIQLANGVLIAGANYRPQKDNITPFTIVVKRSRDNGTTWLPEQTLYEAEPRYTDGCWEPAFLQLPAGEVQVYFANEKPYTESAEQEISLLSSKDNGATWTKEITTVSFRQNRRDGMPVPVLLGNEIAVSIEDNRSGNFQPYIVRTSLENNWNLPVWGDSPYRESALLKPYPDHVYAGAPYLMQIPGGELILSYQTDYGRTNKLEIMEVAISDKSGRQFSKITRPFHLPEECQTLWNAISLWDENRIVAISSTNGFSPNTEIWSILGHIIPEPVAVQGTVAVDGSIEEAEWGTVLPIFIGHQGRTNVSAAIRYDANHLYLCARITDNSAAVVTFFIDAENYNLLAPDTGLFKIQCDSGGGNTVYEGYEGSWKKTMDLNGIISQVQPGNNGYSLELKIPFSALKKENTTPIRFNMSLKCPDYEEFIVHSKANASHTWCKVSFQ